MKSFMRAVLVIVCLVATLSGRALEVISGAALSEARYMASRSKPVRSAASGVTAVSYPRWFAKLYLKTAKAVFVLSTDFKYEMFSLWARALAVYCWATRQEGYEGLRMSYWRWLATIHLAYKQLEQRKTAMASAYDLYYGSAGVQYLSKDGKWRPQVAGGAGITRVGQVSPLYYSQVAGGLPVLKDLSFFPGNIFFVDSGNTGAGGDSSGYGSHPDSPLLTIDFAISLCTASQADVIFALPGHNEGLNNTTIDLDVAGISVVGVGRGADRPRVDYDHASSSIDIGASSCMIKNIALLPSVTDVLIAIDNETLFTDAVLEDIEVLAGEDGAGVDDFAAGIELKVGCTRATIKGYLFDEYAASAGYYRAIYFNGASTRVRITKFWIEISGAAAVAGIEGTGSSLRSLIEDGVIITDAEPGIELAAGQTGVIKDVTIFGDLATIAAATVAAGMAHDNVHYIEVGNESNAAVKTASADD